jgi:hypothetical protein
VVRKCEDVAIRASKVSFMVVSVTGRCLYSLTIVDMK